MTYSLSADAATLLAQLTPRPDGTMPCTCLCWDFRRHDDAEDELIAAGAAYRYEGALFRAADWEAPAPFAGPRYIVIRSPGSLFNVYDRAEQRSVGDGCRFQPEAARAEAARLNGIVDGLEPFLTSDNLDRLGARVLGRSIFAEVP